MSSANTLLVVVAAVVVAVVLLTPITPALPGGLTGSTASVEPVGSTEYAESAEPAVPDPAPRPQEPSKDPEKLPEFPKLAPGNTVQALTPDRTIVGEFSGEAGKRKLVRVGLACEVCLREGPLEVFLCKKGTKEHEAIVRVDVDAKLIHLALIAAGAKPGTPTQFIDPKTEEPKWKAATGTPVNVLVHYSRGGKVYTHPARDWVLDRVMTKKNNQETVLPHGWVFAGSIEIRDPEAPDRPAFYAANSGDIISISNFPYSMLEIPVEISKDDANLTYEARTALIPPLFSKVWVILEPVIDKK